jgi:ABC-type transport system involved in cytochrome c biogenesis permease subunit
MPLDGITRFCFAASYAVALALELAHLLGPRPVLRLISLLFGAAGLLAHTLFLLVHRPSLAAPFGSLLALGWVLAVFYLFGALHRRKQAWGVFVLPLVLGLVALTWVFPEGAGSPTDWLPGERFWGALHGALILLAAVGVSIGFLASVMYLVQARRLRAKAMPGRGLRLMSLERLEAMNRRAVTLAFPFLTLGLLVGAVLLAQREGPPADWTIKVGSTVALWVVFGVLLYLRYGAAVSGRRLAVLTIAAFSLLLVALAATHPIAGGAVP